MSEKGTVYWITGLSGAGKTTIGRQLYEHLRSSGDGKIVYLDGDTLREVFGGHHGHSPAERRSLAMQYSRLSKTLSDQGIDVICTTVSMFHEVREWNRARMQNYVEVYIRVPMEELIRRDQKQLYSRASKGELTQVVGVDLEFEEPRTADVVLDNDGGASVEEQGRKLIDMLKREMTHG